MSADPGIRIDFRTDSVVTLAVSRPRAASESAVRPFEEAVAAALGKEDAVLLPNRFTAALAALKAHAAPGTEWILAERSYFVQSVSGRFAMDSAYAMRPASPDSPHLRLEDCFLRLRDKNDPRTPNTGLVCVEQLTEDGTLFPLPVLAEIKRAANKRGVPVFMDGARLLHAAAASGTDPKKIAGYADTVALSLNKGLGAGTGSVLAGRKAVIDAVRAERAKRGETFPEGGAAAAAADPSLKGVLPPLRDSIDRARRLDARLAKLSGVRVAWKTDANLVFIKLPGFKDEPELLIERMRMRGILMEHPKKGIYRLALHAGITDDHASEFMSELGSILSSGGPPPGVN